MTMILQCPRHHAEFSAKSKPYSKCTVVLSTRGPNRLVSRKKKMRQYRCRGTVPYRSALLLFWFEGSVGGTLFAEYIFGKDLRTGAPLGLGTESLASNTPPPPPKMQRRYYSLVNSFWRGGGGGVGGVGC